MKKSLLFIFLGLASILSQAQTTIYTNDMEYVVGDVKQAFIQNKITTETQAQYLLVGLKNLGVNAVRVPIFAEGLDPNKTMFDYFYNLVVAEGLPIFANPAQHAGGQRIANGVLAETGGSVKDDPSKTDNLINRIKDFAMEYHCKWINPFNEDGAPGGAWSASQMNTIYSGLHGNLNGAELVGPCAWGIPASISVLNNTDVPNYITVAGTHNLGYNHEDWAEFISLAKLNGLAVWDSEVNHNISESNNAGTRIEVAIAAGVDGLMMYNIWNTINLTNGAINNSGKVHMAMYLKNMPKLTSKIRVQGNSWQETNVVSANSGSLVELAPTPEDGSWSWTGPNGYSANTRQISISSLSSSNAGNYVASYTSPEGEVNNIVVTVGLNCVNSPSITPYYRINEVSWISDTEIDVDEGSLVQIGPQSSTSGTWIWNGPNEFMTTARQINFSDISKSQEGVYTITRISEDACVSSKEFNVWVSDVKVPFPESEARYFIDCPEWDLRLGSDGKNAFTTSTDNTDYNVQWTVKESTTAGYYYIDCIGSIPDPRIRTDRSGLADMTTRGSTGGQAKWELTESSGNTFVLETSLDQTSLPRLQIDAFGKVAMTYASVTDNTVKFTFTNTKKGLVTTEIVSSTDDLKSGELQLLFPTLITRSGEQLKPFTHLNDIVSYQLDVYNVQGQHIFQTNDVEKGWSPNSSQDGMYIYSVNYTSISGKSYTTSGKVICKIK